MGVRDFVGMESWLDLRFGWIGDSVELDIWFCFTFGSDGD